MSDLTILQNPVSHSSVFTTFLDFLLLQYLHVATMAWLLFGKAQTQPSVDVSHTAI